MEPLPAPVHRVALRKSYAQGWCGSAGTHSAFITRPQPDAGARCETPMCPDPPARNSKPTVELLLMAALHELALQPTGDRLADGGKGAPRLRQVRARTRRVRRGSGIGAERQTDRCCLSTARRRRRPRRVTGRS
jgi:hypothetical protein